MILVVALDLQTQSPKHVQLYEYLKKQGGWAHYMGPLWFIDTTRTPQQLGEEMRAFVEPADRYFITQLGQYWGVAPKEMWTWLQNRFTRT